MSPTLKTQSTEKRQNRLHVRSVEMKFSTYTETRGSIPCRRAKGGLRFVYSDKKVSSKEHFPRPIGQEELLGKENVYVGIWGLLRGMVSRQEGALGV